MAEARIISGAVHRDVRGVVRHVNEFDFRTVDRFYTIQPAKAGEVRGWVGHSLESKWFFPVVGRFDFGIVRPGDWNNVSRSDSVRCERLDGRTSSVLEVPPGYFTACRALDEQAILLVFSSGKIERAHNDAVRLPADYWSIPATYLSGV